MNAETADSNSVLPARSQSHPPVAADTQYDTAEQEELSTQSLVPIPSDKGFSWRKLFAFIGPAFFVSVGYMDPGNWATDIEAGSNFGYKLVWVLLLSNLMALLLQTLAARMGLVTGRDLAQLCRLQYTRRICVILWILCEIAIAATDLAEVLGTAIGLNLLFGLPLLVGTLLTAGDTLLFLIVQKYRVRRMEGILFVLLFTIASCFVVELFIVRPPWGAVLLGVVPTLDSQSIYIAIGIIGATVMPHNFYLHSSVVQSRDLGLRDAAALRQACKYNLIDCSVALNIAFFVNASILIVSSAVFHSNGVRVDEIQMAHDLLEQLVDSKLAPILFGLGLVAAGQSSTLTGTLAGQVVMEGFLKLKMRPWLRRLVTRLLAVVPAVIVILVTHNKGTYRLLIFSQVILSLQLPFAIVPLIKFTSCSNLMRLKTDALQLPESEDGTLHFASPRWVVTLAWTAAALVIAFNLWMIGSSLFSWWTALWLDGHKAAVVFTALLVVPLAAALLVLLLYLIITPPKAGNTREYQPLGGSEVGLELVAVTHAATGSSDQPADVDEHEA